MKLNKENIKNVLFVIVLALLMLNILQSNYKIIDINPLSGAIEKVEDSYFSKKTWFSGEYQETQKQYVKNNFALRAPFIRINNQLDYFLYDELHAKGVVFGKNGFLYEENYIKAYLGLDYLGEDSIRKQVQKLKTISDSLKKHDVDLVVLLAPGKGSFYPEYFPPKYDSIQKTTTNYATFKQYLQQDSILLFDAHSWFDELKTTVHPKHKLFSKTGIHWSKYGEYLVMDSLLHFLAKKTERQFPTMVLDTLILSKQLKESDNDIWKGMNLWFPMEDFEMTYPKFHTEDTILNTCKVLTISDSYYWGMYNLGLSKNYFSNGEFWYYYMHIYSKYSNTPTLISTSHVKSELLKNDVVLIICTDANLFKFGFGFLDHSWK